MNRRTFAALLLLAYTLVAAPGHAQTRPVVGVGTHSADARSIARLRELGVRHTRYTLYWAEWEQKPAYRTEWNAGVRRFLQAGIQPLIVVHQPPKPGFEGRDATFRAFAGFVAARAREHPQVEAWELFNEPDAGFAGNQLFGHGRGLSPRAQGREYGRMLRVAFPAIKAANPAALVVAGALANPSVEYVRGIRDAGGRYDVLSVHLYGFPITAAFGPRLEPLRAAFPGDRIWVTEFGMEEAVIPADWPRDNARIDGWHLENWRDPILLNERRGLAERMYGHVLAQDGDRSYDLVRRNGTWRPAAVWLKQYLAR